MRYWIAFDLGLRGNYEELYAWLDKVEAQECSGNVATFQSKKTRDELAKELSEILDLKTNPRIYMIDLKHGGKYIFGKRKPAPWAGYFQQLVESGEER